MRAAVSLPSSSLLAINNTVLERVNDFDTAGGRSLGSEFDFFERRKWKVSE
jgi:hypothetical protein